jgi:hypothetical protein
MNFLPSPEFPDDVVLRAVVQTSGASLAIDTPTGGHLMAHKTSFFLDASTSGALASVSLSPQYEGTYDLRTSRGAHVYVVEGEEVSDPAGRNRTISGKNSTEERAKGSIYWSYDGEPTEGVQRGAVKVTTSAAPVKLFV